MAEAVGFSRLNRYINPRSPTGASMVPRTVRLPAWAVNSGTQYSRRCQTMSVRCKFAPLLCTNGAITGTEPSPWNSTSPFAPMCRQEKLQIAAVRSLMSGSETYSFPVGRYSSLIGKPRNNLIV